MQAAARTKFGATRTKIQSYRGNVHSSVATFYKDYMSSSIAKMSQQAESKTVLSDIELKSNLADAKISVVALLMLSVGLLAAIMATMLIANLLASTGHGAAWLASNTGNAIGALVEFATVPVAMLATPLMFAFKLSAVLCSAAIGYVYTDVVSVALELKARGDTTPWHDLLLNPNLQVLENTAANHNNAAVTPVFATRDTQPDAVSSPRAGKRVSFSDEVLNSTGVTPSATERLEDASPASDASDASWDFTVEGANKAEQSAPMSHLKPHN